MARYYSSIAQEAELTSSLSAAATSATVDALVGWPASTPFTAVIDPGTSSEEIVTVTSVGGTTLTIIRGEDGSSPIEHSAGASVRHLATGRDLREAQEHIESSSNVHGVGLGSAVVGTGTSQTLTNKTISGADNALSDIPQSAVTGLESDLQDLQDEIDAEELAREAHALSTAAHGASGAVVGTTNTQTLTNKTLSAPVITNPPSNVANPPGALVMWAGGSTPPDGWLLCDGSAVSRSTYSALFAAIGTSYGAGNGSTTFNLPDLRGRVPVGYNASESDFNSMGKSGGAKTVTLTTSQIPSHSHSINHTHSGTTAGSGVSATFSTALGSGPGASVTPPAAGRSSATTFTDPITGSTHTHSFTTGGPSASNSGSTGGGGAHNNLQPYLTVRYIIKH